MNQSEQNLPEIYLAPLQGFTNAVYRKAYSEVFPGIDVFFIPYISAKNNQILNKYEKEILKVNNPQKRVVPQVLVQNSEELIFLTQYLIDQGYSEINLNMGCPYPMVTNRRQGAGLLPHSEKIKEMLDAFFHNFSIELSVKMRAGLNSSEEIKNVIPVLNEFPLSEIILHPRIAKQLYSGTVSIYAFEFAYKNTHHKLVFNGDVLTISDFERIKSQFPKVQGFMLGRGILQNPFLPAEIRNMQFSDAEKAEKLAEFHHRVLENYLEWMDNEGNALNKMKQFWIYFNSNFGNGEKILKRIKKIRTLSNYKTETKSILSEYTH